MLNNVLKGTLPLKYNPHSQKENKTFEAFEKIRTTIQAILYILRSVQHFIAFLNSKRRLEKIPIVCISRRGARVSLLLATARYCCASPEKVGGGRGDSDTLLSDLIFYGLIIMIIMGYYHHQHD